MDEEATVEITVEEYEYLLQEQDFLNCLRAAGVDNWEGYSEAIEMMEDDQYNA